MRLITDKVEMRDATFDTKVTIETDDPIGQAQNVTINIQIRGAFKYDLGLLSLWDRVRAALRVLRGQVLIVDLGDRHMEIKSGHGEARALIESRLEEA